MSEELLINRVANSGLITINLEDYYPAQPLAFFDIKNFLFQGLILKEKDFRTALSELDWHQYQDKLLLIYCSADAIIPVWAYMLVTQYAQPFVKDIFLGDEDEYLRHAYQQIIDRLEMTSYENQRLVIKGCSQKPVPPAAYAYLTLKLTPIAQSIMYGEPCSTVPVFKRKG